MRLLARFFPTITLCIGIIFGATVMDVAHAREIEATVAPAPEVLGNCSTSGPTRFSTYWAFSVVCTSGTGGVQSKLSILTTSGIIVTDYGPCVGKYSGSPAYVYPPWYTGGMSGSRVWVANWRSC